MGKFVRSFNFEGAYVKIVSDVDSFDVSISIAQGAILSKKGSKNSCCLEFKTGGRTIVAKETIRLKLTNKSYNKDGQFKVFEKTFKIDDGVQCIISITPAFYLSERLRDEYWRQREVSKTKQVQKPKEKGKSKAKAKVSKGKCSKLKVSKGARGYQTRTFAQYTNTNVFHPYSGGGCSSK